MTRWIAITAVVAALLIWFLVGRGSSQATTTDHPAEATQASTTADHTRGFRTNAASRAATADAQAPIIDEVVLEKTSVCEGEENLVTIKAHSPDAADEPFLHYMVGGEKGMTVPVRGTSEPGVLDKVKIIAFGRNGVSTTADLPHFEVRPCHVEHQLFISSRLLPNSTADFELTAHLDPVSPTAHFEPVRYVWKFGDGSTSETSVPVDSHDYSHRPQETLATTFLISCTAYSRSNDHVEGRATIELNNLAYETLAYKGVVQIMAELDPRFPEPDANGVSVQRVKLWSPYSHPIRIEHLKRQQLVMGKDSQQEEVSLDALGVSSIGAGKIVDGNAFRLDPATAGDVYSTEYYISGTTDDGWPATGNFAIMTPPKAPTPANNTPVIDPVLKAKILRARELLGKKFVTDEDIWRLEREGLMKDLHVEAPTGAPPPEPPRPPAPTPSSNGR